VTNASSGWSNSWRAERGMGKEKQRGYARFRQLMESMDLSKPPMISSNHGAQVASSVGKVLQNIMVVNLGLLRMH